MKQLTENQEKLIEQIKNEFLAMNESETPSSFADLLLSEIDNARKEIESIRSKSYALFEELNAQYIKDVNYLKTECAKLGIDIENHDLHYSDCFNLCRSTIILKHPRSEDYDVYFSVAVPTRYHSKSGMGIHEVYGTLQYGLGHTYDFDHLYSFNTFINSKNFKDRVLSLYHRI